ncbi:hypothetical protein [Polaromonas sp. CG_9.11]|uniref:hypothetical protein n=1 Tax=Polaromonas sp. CG_9.11 TaxID=2787730 RepID=UPI0018CA476B|nr:hypothetical protein [Polaromonas sp. CG_9.11]MBG6075430.1 hypothetical protein [Polaromonas sp. CG_9.11]
MTAVDPRSGLLLMAPVGRLLLRRLEQLRTPKPGWNPINRKYLTMNPAISEAIAAPVRYLDDLQAGDRLRNAVKQSMLFKA